MLDFRGQNLYNLGPIFLVTGPMFAGKTAWVQRKLIEWECEDAPIFQREDTVRKERQIENVITFKNAVDLNSKLEEVLEKIRNKKLPEIIVFEECHFLPLEFFNHIDKLISWGIVLLFCGLRLLNNDVRRFMMKTLEGKADFIVNLEGTDFCSSCKGTPDYSLSYRKSTKSMSYVGGSDTYQALCMKCFIKKEKYKEKNI